MAIEELKQNSETKTFTLNLNNCTRPFFLFSRCVMSDSFTTPWPVACQASLSMGFPRREYWSRLPFPSPRDLPNPRVEPTSPNWKVNFLQLSHQRSPTTYGQWLPYCPSAKRLEHHCFYYLLSYPKPNSCSLSIQLFLMKSTLFFFSVEGTLAFCFSI